MNHSHLPTLSRHVILSFCEYIFLDAGVESMDSQCQVEENKKFYSKFSHNDAICIIREQRKRENEPSTQLRI